MCTPFYPLQYNTKITASYLGHLCFCCLSSPRYRLLWRESSCPVLHFNENGEHRAAVCTHAVVACTHACETVMQHLCRHKLLSSLLHCQDFPRCDLLIVMGTSLQVQPFAGLVSRYCRSSFQFLEATAEHTHTQCRRNNLAVYCSLSASETVLQYERLETLSTYILKLPKDYCS